MKNLFLGSMGLAFLILIFSPVQTMAKDARETTYERILRTNTIRCGYFPYEPALIVDANTKKKSGIFYDLTEEMARRLGFKIDWTEEVGYGEMIQGFETGRYDLFCNVVFPTPERSRAASFSIPLYYSVVGVFVRDNDHRFDGNLEKLNDPGVTLAVKDGDITASVASSVFPKAKFVSVPQMALTEQQLEEVAAKKADATFNEPVLLDRFNKNSDKKLRNIAEATPLKYFPATYIMPKSDFQLKQMIDTTLGDMISDGFVERTLKKYEPSPNSYYRVNYPFQNNKTP
ncbi:MAG: amino acid transporter substrate-binding protein family [Alphaproteobacteria bacterium]|nr:amino acid transporter substrate-binding protein family [Alphaproteobacteria bacterium]